MISITYQLSLYNRRHRLKAQIEPAPAHSFVKAFLQLLYCITSNLSQNIIDSTNTSRAVTNANFADSDVTHPGLSSRDSLAFQSFAWDPLDLNADQKGIMVGTGSTAVAVADDNLVTPIANGSSAGQFVYYGCWGLNYTTGASSASFDIERIFRNDSGGSIVVAEIGIYAGTSMGSGSGSAGKSFCILRDVLGATVTVLNGEYLKVKYTITVSN